MVDVVVLAPNRQFVIVQYCFNPKKVYFVNRHCSNLLHAKLLKAGNHGMEHDGTNTIEGSIRHCTVTNPTIVAYLFLN